MSILGKKITLVLNSIFVPVGYMSAKKGITAMCSSKDGKTPAAKALDIVYEKDEKGEWDYLNPTNFRIVDWDEWITLPVNEHYPVIHSTKLSIRVPTVIVAINYNKLHMRRLKPTKKRILDRYGNRCIYTNKVLPSSQLNIEHVIPKSRGGKDGWNNLAPCDKKLNSKKGSKRPEEMGLRTQYPLSEPPPSTPLALIKEAHHPTWLCFLKHLH